MFHRWFGFAAIMLGAVGEAADDATQVPTADAAAVAQRALELEKQVLKARLEIASGEADVIIRRPDGRGPLHWKLWFDNDRLRMEQLDNQGQSYKKIVRVPGNIFHRNVAVKESTGAAVLSPAEVHPDDWNGTMLFDLRKIGLIPVPTGVLHSVDFKGRPVGDPERERLSMEPVDLDGRTVTQIVMKTHGGEQTTRLWIDESRGPSLVRVEHEAEYRGKTYRDVQNITLGEVDGVWFPVKLVLQPYVNGWPRPAETTELENVRLNQGVDDELFTLESVGVEPGELVNVSPLPADGHQIWDGEKLTPINPKPPTESQPQSNSRSTRRVLVWVNVAAAGLLLAGFFSKRPRGKSA